MMKLISTLFVVSAIIGLGQAHQFPDFGSGPLHEDIQDFLDLVPSKEINKIGLDYISKDSEVQAALKYLSTSTILKDLVEDVEDIPEMINLMNYMQGEGVDIYFLVNEVNKALGIAELVPPPVSYFPMQRTGGLAGFFEDIKKVIPFNKFIRSYVHKMKTSSAFVGFINQLKSNNFQQLVNELYQIESFQIIINGLKSSGVNTQIVTDVMYIVLGITVPNDVSVYQERTLQEELLDFVELIPAEEFVDIVIKYINEDQRVQDAVLYMFTLEFESNLRDVEALKEYQALVTFFEKIGLSVTDYIKSLHKATGMKDYVLPKIESIFESQIGMQKIGDGMKGMFEDLYNILPIDKIDALYEQKLQNSKVFAEFVEKLKSPEIQKLIDDLYKNQTFQNFITTAKENGLELQEIVKFSARIFGLKFTKINVHM